MKDDRRILHWAQLSVYVAETGILIAMLTLAASRSPEFVLGPVGRLLVAAALPLPCHLLWLMHVLWQDRALRVPALPSHHHDGPVPVGRPC